MVYRLVSVIPKGKRRLASTAPCRKPSSQRNVVVTTGGAVEAKVGAGYPAALEKTPERMEGRTDGDIL